LRIAWSQSDGNRCCSRFTGRELRRLPDESFDDWVVRGEIGNEFGHYPTREDAEQVAQAIAQEREAELVVHLPDGRTTRKSYKKGWVARLLDMIGRH
jgi:Uncharacterized protein conserved in bacteria (DUF2188)